MTANSKTQRRSSVRGSAMVEYALVLPLYLCLFLGVVNISLMMYLWNCTAYASRAATRYAITHGSTASYVCTAADLKNLVTSGMPGLQKSTVVVTWSPDNSPGSTININVKLMFSTFVPLIKSQSLALASSSQMTIVK